MSPNQHRICSTTPKLHCLALILGACHISNTIGTCPDTISSSSSTGKISIKSPFIWQLYQYSSRQPIRQINKALITEPDKTSTKSLKHIIVTCFKLAAWFLQKGYTNACNYKDLVNASQNFRHVCGHNGSTWLLVYDCAHWSEGSEM